MRPRMIRSSTRPSNVTGFHIVKKKRNFKSTSPGAPGPIRDPKTYESYTTSSRRCEGEAGQALVEMLIIMLVCIMMGVGIYEAGAFFHNVSVINAAVETGATYASRGAPYGRIQRAVERETLNLLSGAFLSQFIPERGIIVEIWNPRTNEVLAPTTESDRFPPKREFVAEYLFWAQGYEARVGVNYRIGIYIPFLRAIVVEQTIASTRTIQVTNDLDRDGMVDSREASYLDWRRAVDGLSAWQHPMHRDHGDTLDTDADVDIDGDGFMTDSDTYPYDFDNDGMEDKFDAGNNDLSYNPVVGPGGWVTP